jgi:peptidyl-prolyl cis-trans isomerase D
MIRFLQKEGRFQKWLLTGALLFVSVSMVWYLVPQGSGNDVNQPNILATVGDEKITVNDAQRAAEQFARVRGTQFPPQLMPMLVDQLITQKATEYEANRLGLRVSDAELRDELQHGPYAPYLFPDGKFIGQEKYEELVSQNGSSVQSFEQEQRAQLLTNKLLNLVSSAVSVTPAEIQREFETQNVKVKLEYAVVTAAAVGKEIKPTEQELRAYYDAHKAEYQNSIPEKRKAKYVAIDLNKIANETPVSREELISYYNQHREEFRRPEEVKASHILIKVTPGPDGKVDPKADTDARAKAEGILKQLKAGANFAELAKKYSDDKASAINGGSLGVFQRGAMVPEFEKVAFSLPVGQLSDLVKTQYGYHIIKVEEHHQAGVPSLEEVKDKIEPIIKQQKAQQAAQKLADAVYDEARGTSLDATAARHNLQVVNTDWFGRGDSLPGIGTSQEFMDAAFLTKQGAPPQETGTQQGYVIFQITGVKPPATPTFDEVRSQVENQFKQEREAQLVRQKTQELSDRAHALHDLKKAAKEVGAEIKASDWLGQQSQAPDLGSLSGAANVAFTLQPGEISGPLSIGQNGAVLTVTDRQEPQATELEKSQDQIRDQLLERKRRDAQEAYLAGLTQQLEQQGKIKKNTQQIAAYARRGEGS